MQEIDLEKLDMLVTQVDKTRVIADAMAGLLSIIGTALDVASDAELAPLLRSQAAIRAADAFAPAAESMARTGRLLAALSSKLRDRCTPPTPEPRQATPLALN